MQRKSYKDNETIAKLTFENWNLLSLIGRTKIKKILLASTPYKLYILYSRNVIRTNYFLASKFPKDHASPIAKKKKIIIIINEQNRKTKTLTYTFPYTWSAHEAEYTEAEAFEDELFWLTTKTGTKKKCFFFFHELLPP